MIQVLNYFFTRTPVFKSSSKLELYLLYTADIQ
jgi:hypothetical protein